MASSPLIFKILGGLSVAAAGTTGAYFLLKPAPIVEKKLKNLNLSNCTLSKGLTTNETGCTLNATDLKEIFKSFSNKGNDPVITGTTATIKIEKTQDKEIFSNGWKFTFGTTSEVTIKSGTDDTNPIILKANTNPEFKINDSNYLEKAWNITTLAKKVGLNCTKNGTNNTCALVNGQNINVYKDNNTKVKGATFNLTNDQKINFTEEETNHNQGFKLTASANISLTGGTGSLNQLTHTNTSYEIKQQMVDGKTEWFLIEKTNS